MIPRAGARHKWMEQVSRTTGGLRAAAAVHNLFIHRAGNTLARRARRDEHPRYAQHVHQCRIRYFSRSSPATFLRRLWLSGPGGLRGLRRLHRSSGIPRRSGTVGHAGAAGATTALLCRRCLRRSVPAASAGVQGEGAAGCAGAACVGACPRGAGGPSQVGTYRSGHPRAGAVEPVRGSAAWFRPCAQAR